MKNRCILVVSNPLSSRADTDDLSCPTRSNIMENWNHMKIGFLFVSSVSSDNCLTKNVIVFLYSGFTARAVLRHSSTYCCVVCRNYTFAKMSRQVRDSSEEVARTWAGDYWRQASPDSPQSRMTRRQSRWSATLLSLLLSRLSLNSICKRSVPSEEYLKKFGKPLRKTHGKGTLPSDSVEQVRSDSWAATNSYRNAPRYEDMSLEIWNKSVSVRSFRGICQRSRESQGHPHTRTAESYPEVSRDLDVRRMTIRTIQDCP